MSKHNFTLSIDYLKDHLEYFPELGIFVWRKSKARATAGDLAGAFSKASGYVSIGLGGKRWAFHRLAFFYMTGIMPAGFIDHIDGDKTNNRIANLREVSNKVNCENRQRAQADNKLGVLGVTRSCSRFAATIKHHGKKIWIGTFDTAEEAHAAYLAKKREIHTGCTL